MKLVGKILIKLSNAIIIYFLVGGLIFRAAEGGLEGYGSVVVAPLRFIWENIGPVAKNIGDYGIQNALLPVGLVQAKSHPNSKYWQNSLNKDLFVLHVVTGSDNLQLVELRSGNFLRTIKLPSVRTNSSQRWIVFLDSKKKVIHAFSDGLPNTLFRLDYSGRVLRKTEFDFSLHHRLNVFEGHVFINIRRTVNNLHQNFNDEGYVELDGNYNIVNKFWLGDHIRESSILGSNYSYNVWPKDPFHLNDVEVVPSLFGKKNIGNHKLNAGDVLLSSRHLNAIVVVRDGKIWAVERGSFNLQHDVDVVNDSIISIFNNNSSCYYVGLCDLSGIPSNIVHFNIRTGKEIIKFDDVRFSTASEGQIQYLKSGRVVIENQNNNEFIILAKDKVVYRGGIMSKTYVGFLDLITWEQVFDENPFN
jgi:hypothetical protein